MNPTCPSMDDTRNIITAFLAALMDTNHDAANVRQTLREFLATQEAPALSEAQAASVLPLPARQGGPRSAPHHHGDGRSWPR